MMWETRERICVTLWLPVRLLSSSWRDELLILEQGSQTHAGREDGTCIDLPGHQIASSCLWCVDPVCHQKRRFIVMIRRGENPRRQQIMAMDEGRGSGSLDPTRDHHPRSLFFLEKETEMTCTTDIHCSLTSGRRFREKK